MPQVMQAHVSKPGLPTDLIPGFLYADHVFVLGSRGGEYIPALSWILAIQNGSGRATERNAPGAIVPAGLSALRSQ